MSNARVWKRAPGKWVLIISGEGANGKRKQKWTTFASKKEADAALKEQLKQDDEHWLSGTNLTVSAWLDRWIRDYMVGLRDSTVENYADHTKPWRAILGSMRLDKLRSPHIRAGMQELLKTRSKGTVAAYVRCLHIALEWAVKDGLLRSNPATGVTPPKADKKAVKPLEAAQIGQVLTAMQGTWFRVPTLLAASTGMRRSECLNLKWEDVDLERGTVSIVQSKTDRGRRMVTLPASVVRELRAEQKQQKVNRLKYGNSYQDNGLVCPRENGSPVSPGSLSQKFHDVAKNLAIVATFHDLRHTHASILLRSGVNMKVVQERLGHSSITETMDTYSHLMQGMQDGATAAAEDLIAAALGGDR